MVNFITAYIKTNFSFNRPVDETTTSFLISEAMKDNRFVNHLMESNPNIRTESEINIDEVTIIKITNELNIGG